MRDSSSVAVTLQRRVFICLKFLAIMACGRCFPVPLSPHSHWKILSIWIVLCHMSYSDSAYRECFTAQGQEADADPHVALGVTFR